jgi:hypothetical protein
LKTLAFFFLFLAQILYAEPSVLTDPIKSLLLPKKIAPAAADT